MKINAYSNNIMVLCESMMMGMATNVVAVRPTLSSIASNSSYCYSVDSVFDTNILLSHAVYPSLCRYGLVTKKIANVCIDYIIACAAVPPPGLVVTKFKTMTIILRAFSTKIRPCNNYPPYGIRPDQLNKLMHGFARSNFWANREKI